MQPYVVSADMSTPGGACLRYLTRHRALHGLDERGEKAGGPGQRCGPVRARQVLVPQNKGTRHPAPRHFGGDAPALRGVVQDVVMKERGLMDHLHG